MIAPNVEQQIRELVAAQIGVSATDDGSYAVDVPLVFPDGDQCRVYVSPLSGARWSVRDGGSSVMRASYAENVDVLAAGHGERFHKLLAFRRLTEEDGEIVCTNVENLGEAVFAMAQASIDVVQLAKTPKAKIPEKAANFRAALSRVVTRAVGSRGVAPDWYNESIDPKRRYPVTLRIEAPSKPLFVFGADSRTTCMHATMSCLFHKMNQYSFTAIAVYESEAAIAKSESERLDALVDRHFRSLEDGDAISEFIDGAMKS
jgi:hypothetical protein